MGQRRRRDGHGIICHSLLHWARTTPHLFLLGLGGHREEVQLGAGLVESLKDKSEHLLLQLGECEGGGEGHKLQSTMQQVRMALRHELPQVMGPRGVDRWADVMNETS